ncbi:efflux RND transporter permease subunit [Candidatus Nitronereus thalassa]|uniref:Efflux RND transporter permease subunit n=1 Tax=Candidatus Nitronereus thalassa TaxID=3020898 RepID=A0ABU3K925_9BACT|nr:efflux RND transporter permease subunit [Candidatus Nitronereus thalassa]MDT7042955.1 efflux RND transporter permease subunit [Candidatus Nitronereus thalassa]
MKNLGNDLVALSVRRPVLIAVVNLLIMLTGLGSLMGVDVRELPDVDRPVISVRSIYEGASPETMDTEVTSILEGAVARVSGVKNIEASSEENNMRLRAEFEPEVDLNDAASEVREAVSRIERELPDDIDQLVVLKADDDANAIVQLSAYSDTLSKQTLAQRIEKDVTPELLSIPGVADVRLNGDQPRVLRVLLDPARMAGFRLSATDVVEILTNARFDVPAGSYESEDQELIVRAYASVVKPEEVKRLHIRDNIRIEDIGDVFYDSKEAESYSLLNGRMVIGLGVVRQAGSNTIEISDEVAKRIERINARARDFSLVVTSDDGVYIRGALQEVLFTLVFATLIVLIVIAVFLGQWQAVLIPAVTMPIALVGTLAAIWLFGFSINLLTLLALVLATGLIVDDAIVVLENIQRLRSQGSENLAAAVLGTRQVFFAVIATTITLVSVFLPIAFLPGQTGRLFREFGLVLAIAVIISSFVAVTLCPMMASRLPQASNKNSTIMFFRNRLNAIGQHLSSFYYHSLDALLSHSYLAIPITLLIAGGGVVGFSLLNQELLPQEDRGSLQVILTGPDGASLVYSGRQSRKVEAVLQPYQRSGVITDIYTIVGRWDKNRTYTKATLAPWDEREISQMALAKEVSRALTDMPGAQVRIRRENSLNVRGAGSGLEIALVGNNYDELSAAADLMSEGLLNQVPEIEDVRIQFDTSQPELSFNIDREKARDLNVPMDRISQMLRVMVDKYELIDLSIEDQAVPIMVSSSQGTINDPGDLLNIFVTNENNDLVPLSAMISVKEAGVAAELDRHAQRRAIELDLAVPPGTALGQVLDKVRTVADEVLPSNVNILFLGEAATLEETNYDVAVTFVIALAVVLLVLAAQFESLGSALIVIFTVPFGLAAAVFALLGTGQSINLYSQIGLVMLVGLMTKNAILLVEFMDQMRDQGMNVHDAIMEGVRVRLRPVTMTVLSTVFGSLPLILSTGPGTEAREAIGWVVFGGLGLSSLFTLYLVPVGYYWIAPHIKPRAHAGQELEAQLQRTETKGVVVEESS